MSSARSTRPARLVAFAFASALGLACSGGGKTSATESSATGETSGGGETDTDTGGSGSCGLAGARCTVLNVNRDVDILLVIDNSGSMAEEQARLTDGVAGFVAALEEANANYRIAVTTTDAGNPRCNGTTPERGALVATSCVDRVALGDFVFALDPPIDASAVCLDRCAASGAAFTFQPTTTDVDAALAPRPWLESFNGISNAPVGLSTTETLRCMAPQGISGCGFESPLEAMRLALQRAQSPSEASYGFLREHAQLAIIILTDEADCSYNPDFDDIFVTNKVFWNDPADVSATSAVCWRAGVQCSSSGPDFGQCDPENYNSNAVAGVAAEDAVLRPVQEYIDFISDLADKKQLLSPDAVTTLSVIAGVPVGYPRVAQSFTAIGDPTYLDDYGVDPGCISAEGGAAVPPVRLRKFAEFYQEGRVTSICGDNYDEALDAVLDRIRVQIKPACYTQCVADVDADAPGLQPACTLQEEIDGVKKPIPPCTIMDDVASLPAGASLCYVVRVDPNGSTASTLDDMSPECVDAGDNLEFDLIRGGPPAPGATVSAQCQLAADPATTCPNP